jgi:hypothetical protein
MDFGFAAFLEKFEAYYGTRATKILVALMGAAVAASCLSLMGHMIFSGRSFLSTDTRDKLGFFLIIAQLAVLIAAGFALTHAYIIMRRLKSSRGEYEKAQSYLDNAKMLVAESRDIADKTRIERKTIIAAAQLVYERAIESAKANDLITTEEVELFKSLLDVEQQTPP